jgi:hypothetical protein
VHSSRQSRGGLKGTAKAAKGAVKNTVKTTVKSVKELGQIGAKGAKTALKNGKIMLQEVKGGFAKGAKSLDDLARQLVGKLRFNKFKLRLQGRRIQLLRHINRWVLLADGNVQEVSFEGQGRKKLGEIVNVGGQDAIVVGIKNNPTKAVDDLKALLPDLQRVADNNGIPREELLDLYQWVGPKGVKYLLSAKTDDEILAALKAVGLEKLDNGHSIFRHGSHVSDPALKKRITEGIAPDGFISPASPSTRFKSFQDWVETRQEALDGIKNGQGQTGVPVDLSQPPGAGGNPPDQSHGIVVEHTSRPDLGQGFRGDGTKYPRSITGKSSSGGTVTTTKQVWPNTAPVKHGIHRTKTTIRWQPDPSVPSGGHWKVVQHIPWARDFDFATNTYTAGADLVL